MQGRCLQQWSKGFEYPLRETKIENCSILILLFSNLQTETHARAHQDDLQIEKRINKATLMPRL